MCVSLLQIFIEKFRFPTRLYTNPLILELLFSCSLAVLVLLLVQFFYQNGWQQHARDTNDL
jgi:hypothetical protein